MVVLVFFEVSYATRFLYDQFIEPIVADDDFWYTISFDFVLFPDGFSFLALLYFHYRNFKPKKWTGVQSSRNSSVLDDGNNTAEQGLKEVMEDESAVSEYVYLHKSKNSISSIQEEEVTDVVAEETAEFVPFVNT